VTETLSFSGTIGPDSITGTLTIARREVSATRIGTGGSSVPVMLR
jgi:hypothetical protein